MSASQSFFANPTIRISAEGRINYNGTHSREWTMWELTDRAWVYGRRLILPDSYTRTQIADAFDISGTGRKFQLAQI